MSNVFQLRRPTNQNRGTVHVMLAEHGGLEIGQESASGNSWGSFETFSTAAEAINGAHQLNRQQYGGICEVSIHPEVLAALPPSTAPDRQRGDF